MLTGATGIMGSETLKQLMEKDLFSIVLLVRPNTDSRRKLKKYIDHEHVRVVWGDLRNYNDVLEAVKGVDIVLHLGGMVSPKADKYPELTMETNVSAAVNIVKAVKAQPNAEQIKIVYIGSVAQMGFREAPNHFGHAAELMNPALFDHYAVSKIIAEKVIAESGLKYWVSLRQSGILYPELIKNGMNPIMFHVPLNGVLEWATVEDSGRLLVNLCEKELPDEFWRKFYNISSGKDFRLTNYEFVIKLLDAIYCPPPEKIFNSNWFATKNFHGCWYSDSDVLEDWLGFRSGISREEYFQTVIKKKTPWYFKLLKIVPARLIKMVMWFVAHNKNGGTMHWIKSGQQEKINTYFGSYEDWKKIPSWDDFRKDRPSEICPPKEDHDLTNKPIEEWTINDMQATALRYGGKCLSDSMLKGDIDTPLLWKNREDRQFYASPRYVIFGGFFPNAEICSKIYTE